MKLALENLLPADGTELFKYQILVDHLKLEEAKLVADSYLNSPTPYTDTMLSLNNRFGQPHQMALHKIASVMDAPDVRRGDPAAFERFALHVQSLVGLLRTLGPEGDVELHCGSHVVRLLSKLPPELRADFRRRMFNQPGAVYTLLDFSEWLQYESWCQDYDWQSAKASKDKQVPKFESRQSKRSVTVLHGASGPSEREAVSRGEGSNKFKAKGKPYCPFCENAEHFLSQCPQVIKLSKDQLTEWIRSNRRCWRCARPHQAAQCNLKKLCGLCQRKHLQVLHDINDRPLQEAVKSTQGENCQRSPPTEVLYVDRPAEGNRVLLKVLRVLLSYGNRTLETYAILDDGSERTMLLPAAVRKLGLQGTSEALPLRTIRQDVQTLHGSSVSFHVSPVSKPKTRFLITGAFTATQLGLADHSYPMDSLQKRYNHLLGLPIPPFKNARPLLLIGTDHPHLITPVEPVRLGVRGGPAAIRTRLGWTLQGPAKLISHPLRPQQCLWTSITPQTSELLKHVERLWQVDTLPFRSEKLVTRSRQDQDAIDLLEARTTRIEIDGVFRYATPLLRKRDMPSLQAPKEAVLPSLRSTERRLARDPGRAKAYSEEIEKLVKAGSVKKVNPDEWNNEGESWFIPHPMVTHNSKNRVVFNCSYQYRGQSLNELLLPGPTLGASLLGVLLRFREHVVAISGDIKGMFHQVRLLPEDRPLLRFVWRDSRDESPQVFEWQVLPFGTTCSPCCATFALQRHLNNHSQPGEDVRFSVERNFYVDNCLQSLPTPEHARELIDKLRQVLASGGFDLRQWASNMPSVVNHLPTEARSDSSELWLAEDKASFPESTLGLSWCCQTDSLGYKHRKVEYTVTTLRNIYRVVASQYDPLGFILPYTTRAKMLIRQLWEKHRDWDDPLLPQDLLQAWKEWEGELQYLSQVTLPRAYLPNGADTAGITREVHVFCDASEQAYGSVAYLRTVDKQGQAHLSFLLARSRVAPKRLHSMPRLELCAALTGAQLARLLEKELTLQIDQVILWSDSTTVLTWLKSESCRFKVFVGTRVAEIHELTARNAWRYVDSASNPADDLTRGKCLKNLVESNRWSQGPPFLLLSPSKWPVQPTTVAEEDNAELRKSTFCGFTSTMPRVDNTAQCGTWKELLEVTAQTLHGAANPDGALSADDYRQAERAILCQAQQDSFPEELSLLKGGKPVPSSSRLLTLSPELDEAGELIRVGGRLRRTEGLGTATLHPIVLDPRHPSTRLLIQNFDSQLCHPGTERVFAEIRRTFWILRGREAVRRYQHTCPECRRARAKPAIPKMADLPPARLRLFKPAFHSTGMDCFGPFQIKVGRRSEKRWGIIFKCLTTRGVHLDLLTNIDADSFLMALRRFIARRGTPAELFSDQGTNFRGGERELREAFARLSPDLQRQLAKQKIAFHFNPPAAPHFGGVWEREIRSVKTALYTTLGSQPLADEVLRTVLIEVEGILNSKPLGYVSSNLTDLDPVTPNLLLMGRRDGSLPQMVYPAAELLTRRRWRHSQVLADHFWSSFIRNYLPSLQTRQKWHSSPADLTEGSIVMMVDPQLPRALWPIGKVSKVHPSADGHIRSADVKIRDRVYTRPVARLVVLPAIPDGAE